VVVVTYNSAKDIEACLSSALASTTGSALEVIVVDNASTDDTVAVARAIADQRPEVTVVANERNLGFGAACNQGVRLGSGEFVLLLNPDTVTHPGALDALLDVAARSGIGPVGGRTVDADGRLDPRSVQNAPSLLGNLAWMLASPVWGSRLPGPAGRLLGRNPALLDPATLSTERPVPVVIGCLLALRRDAWERLGGFDESFFMYGEDVDLSLRARRLGLTPVFTPDALITHLVGRSSETYAAKLVLAMCGRATVMARHWSPAEARLGRLLLVLGVGIRGLGERLHGGPGPWAETFAQRRKWSRGYPDGSAARNGSAA
jgi:GT2 family glycosyltransferase